MAQSKSRNVEELAAVVHEAAKGLSARAVATLVAHPPAVRSALAVAADALSAEGSGRRDSEFIRGAEARLVDAEEADRRIAMRTRPGRPEGLLSSDELAARTGLKTRQSVHDWLKKGKIIGWQSAKRGYVFPPGQLDERGRPLKGLDRIVSHFEDGYAAWVWLTTPRAALEGVSPLARLRQGEIDRVAAAAEGDVQGDFA
ncbi:MAG: hypothetical protein ACR2RB_18565 [Gammaproteobacteria bacterium]